MSDSQSARRPMTVTTPKVEATMSDDVLKAQATEELFGAAIKMAQRMGCAWVPNEVGEKMIAERMAEIAARTPTTIPSGDVVDKLGRAMTAEFNAMEAERVGLDCATEDEAMAL